MDDLWAERVYFGEYRVWVILWIVFILDPEKDNRENGQGWRHPKGQKDKILLGLLLRSMMEGDLSLPFSSSLFFSPLSSHVFSSPPFCGVKSLAHGTSAFSGVRGGFCCLFGGDECWASSVSSSLMPLVPVLLHQKGKVMMLCACSRVKTHLFSSCKSF